MLGLDGRPRARRSGTGATAAHAKSRRRSRHRSTPVGSTRICGHPPTNAGASDQIRRQQCRIECGGSTESGSSVAVRRSVCTGRTPRLGNSSGNEFPGKAAGGGIVAAGFHASSCAGWQWPTHKADSTTAARPAADAAVPARACCWFCPGTAIEPTRALEQACAATASCAAASHPTKRMTNARRTNREIDTTLGSRQAREGSGCDIRNGTVESHPPWPGAGAA